MESCEQPRWQAGHLCSSDGWLWSAQVPAASWCHPATLVPSPPAHTAPTTAVTLVRFSTVSCASPSRPASAIPPGFYVCRLTRAAAGQPLCSHPLLFPDTAVGGPCPVPCVPEP